MVHLNPYFWADRGREGGAEALSVTVLPRRDEKDVFTALRIATCSRRELTFAQLEDTWGADHIPVQIWSEPSGVVLVEHHGLLTSSPEGLPRIAGEEAASVFWHVDEIALVAVVRAGELVRMFIPQAHDDEPPLPEESGLPFGPTGRPFAASLALLARLTGFQATRERMLVPARPTYDVSILRLLSGGAEPQRFTPR